MPITPEALEQRLKHENLERDKDRLRAGIIAAAFE